MESAPGGLPFAGGEGSRGRGGRGRRKPAHNKEVGAGGTCSGRTPRAGHQRQPDTEAGGGTIGVSKTERGERPSQASNPHTWPLAGTMMARGTQGPGATLREIDPAQGSGLAMGNSSGPRSQTCHFWSCLFPHLVGEGASPSHLLFHGSLRSDSHSIGRPRSGGTSVAFSGRTALCSHHHHPFRALPFS